MRYLPLTHEDRMEMMSAIGVKSVDDLYKQVPKKAFIKGLANLPLHKGEIEVERIMSSYANQRITPQAKARSSLAPAAITTMSRRPSTTSSSGPNS